MNLDPIPTNSVKSSNIAAIGYDFKSATMVVLFKSRSVIYHYAPIPKPLFDRFKRSISKGSFFSQWIRNNPAIESMLWCDCEYYPTSGEHLSDCVAMKREKNGKET